MGSRLYFRHPSWKKTQYSPFNFLWTIAALVRFRTSFSPVKMSFFPQKKSAARGSRPATLDNCSSGAPRGLTPAPPPSTDGMRTWFSWVIRSSPGAPLTSVDFSLWNIYGAQAGGWSRAAGILAPVGWKGLCWKSRTVHHLYLQARSPSSVCACARERGSARDRSISFTSSQRNENIPSGREFIVNQRRKESQIGTVL